jgi:broad specificity phosphatase PhoE
VRLRAIGTGVEAYLVRHAEVEANVRQVLVGRGDSPFTEAGLRQPAMLADALREVPLVRIYTSPVRRARETADRIRAALGRDVPLEDAAAIAEIDAGDFEGLPFEEVRARLRTMGAAFGDGDVRYPGGESWGDVQRRALAFVQALERRHGGDAVLLVTHAGVIAALVAHALGEPVGRFVRVRFGHDFVGRLRVERGRIVEYAHLRGTVDRWF